MPRFEITWEFAGEEFSDIIECDSLEEAEWQASDNLQGLIRSRTAYSAKPVEDEE